jgi:glycosyltransferase involved in cell wall biosynthesis
MEPWQYGHRLRWRREWKMALTALSDLAHGAPKDVPWQSMDHRVRMLYVPTLAAHHVPDADVVVATSWRTAESVARYPTSKGRAFYLLQHYETWDGPDRRVDATWRAPLQKIVIAEWLEDEARRLEAGAVARIANGLDLARFQVLSPLDRRPRRVVMLWSSAPIKGGPQGVAALEQARASVPDLQAVLFGVGPRPHRLPRWIEYVRNPPQDVLVREIYNGSSVYLCPSRGEGWHLPPAEAMACGCAVVSTDIGGVRDYARHGETALLAPVDDVVALAGHIVTLCRDDGMRQAMATAAGACIRAFTWERAVSALEAALTATEVAVA